MKFFNAFIYLFHDILISKLTYTGSCTKMPFTSSCYLNVGILKYIPVDIGRKLSVLCTFNLRPCQRGYGLFCQNSQILQSITILQAQENKRISGITRTMYPTNMSNSKLNLLRKSHQQCYHFSVRICFCLGYS